MDNHEIEALPLVKIRPGLSLEERRRRRLLVCAGCVVFIAIILVALFSNARNAEETNTTDVVTKVGNQTNTVGKAKATSSKSNCPEVCSALKQERINAYGGDLLNGNDLLKLVTDARDKALTILREQYGESAFSAIFEEKQGEARALRKAVVSANATTEKSSEKFKRKLMIKLLAVQTELVDEAKKTQGCDCGKSRGMRHNHHRRLQVEDSKSKLRAQFIWATGGHSAAAGHGNLYNESYTAFMESTAKDVFASVGIDFIGKNYAMGGTSSAPEVALCAEAIYGSDPDAVSWDFGMTDGGDGSKLLLYNYRAALLPGRPALFGLNLGKRQFRRDCYVDLENDGLPSFVLEPGEEKKMLDAIPDTAGMKDEEILALAPFVRNLKCDHKIENGDPYCNAEKFSKFICPDRKFRTSWHPGWKAQALTGNTVALFLMEALVDAAKELASKSEDPHRLLAELKAQEDAEYEKFIPSMLPLSVLTQLKSSIYDQVSSAIIYKAPVLCHTALLPAETRFQGYLTESDKKGFWNFDKGTSRHEVDSYPPGEKDVSPMRLVFEQDKRQDCPVQVNVDYKDYFFTSTPDGWTTLTIPNETEIKAYRYDSSKINGFIMVCFSGCDWGKCPEGSVNAKEIDEGKGQLEVNGLPVKSLEKFEQCSILRGEDGMKWKPNNEGRFVLRAKVNQPNSFIRIASVVIL